MIFASDISKKRLIIGNLAHVFLGLVALFLSISCSALASSKEISRVSSPDSVVDAVLVEVNGGATTDFMYFLYIVPKGGKYEKGSQLFVITHDKGLKIFWERSKFLVIEYDEGKILQFQNYWYSRDVQNLKYVVELRLIPKTGTFSLSEEDRRLKY
jgi:hypothetical protein